MPRSQSRKSIKVFREKEIRCCGISIPAMVRDFVSLRVAENTKNHVTITDEKGDSYKLVLKFRKNSTKPELIPSRGLKKFVQKRNLRPNDTILFLRGTSPNNFRVLVNEIIHHWPLMAPPKPAARRKLKWGVMRPQAAYPEVANLAAAKPPGARPPTPLLPYPALSSHHQSFPCEEGT